MSINPSRGSYYSDTQPEDTVTRANNGPTSRPSDSYLDRYSSSNWKWKHGNGNNYDEGTILAVTNPDCPTEDDSPIRTTSIDPAGESYMQDAVTLDNNGPTSRVSDSDYCSAVEQDSTSDPVWREDFEAISTELRWLCKDHQGSKTQLILERMSNLGACWKSELDPTRIFELRCKVKHHELHDDEYVWTLKSESNPCGVEKQH